MITSGNGLYAAFYSRLHAYRSEQLPSMSPLPPSIIPTSFIVIEQLPLSCLVDSIECVLGIASPHTRRHPSNVLPIISKFWYCCSCCFWHWCECTYILCNGSWWKRGDYGISIFAEEERREMDWLRSVLRGRESERERGAAPWSFSYVCPFIYTHWECQLPSSYTNNFSAHCFTLWSLLHTVIGENGIVENCFRGENCLICQLGFVRFMARPHPFQAELWSREFMFDWTRNARANAPSCGPFGRDLFDTFIFDLRTKGRVQRGYSGHVNILSAGWSTCSTCRTKSRVTSQMIDVGALVIDAVWRIFRSSLCSFDTISQFGAKALPAWRTSSFCEAFNNLHVPLPKHLHLCSFQSLMSQGMVQWDFVLYV